MTIHLTYWFFFDVFLFSDMCLTYLIAVVTNIYKRFEHKYCQIDSLTVALSFVKQRQNPKPKTLITKT